MCGRESAGKNSLPRRKQRFVEARIDDPPENPLAAAVESWLLGCITASTKRVSPSNTNQLARDIAAWLAKRTTEATLRERTVSFGLTHPDGVHNLINRADAALARSAKLRKEVERLRQSILRAHMNAPRLSLRPKKTKTGPFPAQPFPAQPF